MEQDPRETYRERRSERAARAARLDRVDASLAFGRLAVALAAIVVGWFAWRRPEVSWWWLAAPAFAFAALVVVHARTIQSRRGAERAVRFYDEGLARLDETPPRNGDGGSRFLDDAHLYARDLDLFGPGSLFARLDTTRTPSGTETLAGWLLGGADPDTVARRQEAVRELKPDVDLREDLYVAGDVVRSEADTERLRRWARERAVPGPAWLRGVAAVLAVFSVSTFLGWLAGAWPLDVFLALLAVQGLVVLPFRRGILATLAGASDPEHDLEQLARVLARFEKARFEAPRLAELRARLESDGLPPSARIRGLARRMDLADARRNQLFLPFSLMLMWGTQTAFALAGWQRDHGPAVERWLDAVGELEALAALAGWAFEHPDDPFPEVRAGDEPRFEAEDLGHPLIPDASCVRNDVRLAGDRRLLVVSGSNMSGKSTLLRTVGVNAVLAQAGAPVRARSLVLTPLAPGATLRIQDSLHTGESRFYAEISRLRAILERATAAGDGKGPAVLFLLDEILAGTNGHDRAIGAEAVLRGLVERGAIGLVTTHDLALAELAGRHPEFSANVHFEDRLEDGRITFDYRMRPGVVERSNALALMRSVGLDV